MKPRDGRPRESHRRSRFSNKKGCSGGHLLAGAEDWGLVLKLDLKKRGVLVRMVMARMC